MENDSHLISRSQTLLGELKSLAKIKFGDKWSTYYRIPQKPGMMNKIVRAYNANFLNTEGKEITIEYIKTLLEKSFNIMLELISDNEKIIKQRNVIKEAILKCQDGIVNLRGAYHDNEDIKQDLKNIIESIKKRFIEFGEDIVYKSPNNKELFE